MLKLTDLSPGDYDLLLKASGARIRVRVAAGEERDGYVLGDTRQLEVRGEVLLTIPAFEALNQRRKNTGHSPLKSPRNTAAGTLRLSDYAEVANRALTIRIFELLATEPMPPTHTEALALLKSVGLPVTESKTAIAGDVLPAIAALNRRRAGFPYQTDGIVVRVNDRRVYERLGATTHHPRGALARKY